MHNATRGMRRAGIRRTQPRSVCQPDPDYHQAQLELGNILLGQRNHEAAAIHFEKASEGPRPELQARARERLRRRRTGQPWF